MKFEKLKWKDVEKQAKDGNLLILPIGSLEQHGYHLPVDTDMDCAHYIAEKVAEKTNTLLLPPIYYGYVDYALDFPGTVSVGCITLTNYIVDIAISLWKTGFKKMLLLNGHGGNTASTSMAANIISEKTEMLFATVMWTSMIGEIYNKEREVGIGENVHAAELETDVKYYIDPDNCDPSKAIKEMGGPLTKYTHMDLGIPSAGKLIVKWKYYTKSGVLGDATKSTIQKGKKWAEAAIEQVCDFVEILKKLDY